MNICLQIECAPPKRGREYTINGQKSLNLASAIRTLLLNEQVRIFLEDNLLKDSHFIEDTEHYEGRRITAGCMARSHRHATAVRLVREDETAAAAPV